MATKPPDEEGLDAPTTLVRMMSETSRFLGTVLAGQYKIIEVIGEGGIGVVYRARQLTVDRDVAIKVLRKQYVNDDLAVRRFENEAKAISRLRHPNTLRLYDCQRTIDGHLYIVTELLTGVSLVDLLRDKGRLPIDRAVRTLDEVCRSLAEAHAAGIVHRDLKPANIFVDWIGDEDMVKVLDFGIAKILQGSGGLTRAGAVPGTPHYMSPEQAAAGRVDHRADIYSLGVILYQMLVGSPPFDGPSVMEILKKHITEPPPPLVTVAPEIGAPPELDRLIGWMLAKDPEDRPQSVAEIRKYCPGILALVTPVRPLLLPEPSGADATLAAVRTLPPNDPEDGAAQAASPKPPPRRWGLASMMTGSIGVLLGIAIGFAAMRDDVVIEAKNEAVAVEPKREAASLAPAAARSGPSPGSSLTWPKGQNGAAGNRPEGQAQGAAKDPAEGKPGALPEGKSGGLAEGKPGGLAEGKPGALAEGKPGALAEGKPGGLTEGKPGGLAEAPAERKPAAPAERKSASSTEVATLTSDPPGAAVIAPDGSQLGTTPLKIDLDEARTYVLVGEGGRVSSILLDPAKHAGKTVRVSLHEAEAAPSPKHHKPPPAKTRFAPGRSTKPTQKQRKANP